MNDNKELLPCPFCGGDNLYLTHTTDELGAEIPIIFCNLCKIEFRVENDSPYTDDEKTKGYLLKKNIEAWNRRKV